MTAREYYEKCKETRKSYFNAHKDKIALGQGEAYDEYAELCQAEDDAYNTWQNIEEETPEACG